MNSPQPSEDAVRPAVRLSVIVATYQAAASLERCLRSVFDQSAGAWQLLVADGGSTDGTIDIIRRYENRIAWWCSEDDGGVYDAWNRALRRAEGEYVCFLGADDRWIDSRAMARLFASIGNSEYDLVTSRGRVRDARTGKEYVSGGPIDFRRLGRRMMVCHPGMLHRRTLFARYGLFDPAFSIAGDLEFLMRLPSDLRTLHVESETVRIDGGGISRSQVLTRLREQREILVRSPRYGPVRGYLAWLDKLWRLPVARLLNIPH